MLYIILTIFFILWPMSLQLVRYHQGLLSTIFPGNPLPDLGHYYTKKLYRKIKKNVLLDQWLQWVPYSLIGLVFLYQIVFYNNSVNIFHFLLYLACIQSFRMLCFNVTILPDISGTSHLKSFWQSFFTGGCNDLIFSGHTAYVYGTFWYLYKMHEISLLVYLYGSLFTLGYGLTLVILKKHYTIDILCAFSACHLMFDLCNTIS